MNLIPVIQKAISSTADFLSKTKFIKAQRRDYWLFRKRIIHLNNILEIILVWTIVAAMFITVYQIFWIGTFALFVVGYTKYVLEDY